MGRVCTPHERTVPPQRIDRPPARVPFHRRADRPAGSFSEAPVPCRRADRRQARIARHTRRNAPPHQPPPQGATARPRRSQRPVSPRRARIAYAAVVTESLALTLRALLDALDDPEPDWQAVEQTWLDACLAAAGTKHEGTMRDSGLALRLRDADRLGAAARHVLSRVERTR